MKMYLCFEFVVFSAIFAWFCANRGLRIANTVNLKAFNCKPVGRLWVLAVRRQEGEGDHLKTNQFCSVPPAAPLELSIKKYTNIST